MYVNDGKTSYQIGKLVAETDRYRLYLCKSDIGSHLCQVATTIEVSGKLDLAVYVLGNLLERSEYYESVYSEKHPGKKLNYDRLFPTVTSSFASKDQGERRINILSFKDIDDIEKTVPLSSLLQKDKLRISLESSAYIMGRLLKLLGIVHDCCFAINITGSNILIQPDNHSVVVLDWSSTTSYPDKVPEGIVRENIKSAANAILDAIANYQDNPEICDRAESYVEYLRTLSVNGNKSADKAHFEFYEIAHKAFGRKFYEFQTFSIS